MYIHILGIGGSLMGSLAQLARAKGFEVSGCDNAVYAPMDEQLQQAGIEWVEGFAAEQWRLKPDLFVIGNSISRGNPLMEELLNRNLRFTSGPQFLAEYILAGKRLISCAGTHGKTSTASMLAWVLQEAGKAAGFLIGGVPLDLGVSAQLGDSDLFVVEADEYDSAFFDKRSKFIHYRSKVLILNNLEYDHADIFADLAEVKKQYHHLVRSLASEALILLPDDSPALDEVIEREVWSQIQRISLSDAGAPWYAELLDEDGSRFNCHYRDANGSERVAEICWDRFGVYNVRNAMAVLAAAHQVGVDIETAAAILSRFSGVKRRLELVARVGQGSREVRVYDDFAHHPTAIKTTLEGLRKKVTAKTMIIAIVESRSYTMRQGVHKDNLAAATKAADFSFWHQDEAVHWPMATYLTGPNSALYSDLKQLLVAVRQCIASQGRPTCILVMSSSDTGELLRQLVRGIKEP